MRGFGVLVMTLSFVFKNESMNFNDHTLGLMYYSIFQIH